MIVYKYVVPERIDVLQNARIRFTQPGALNDPFEALPCYLEYKHQLIHGMEQRMGVTLAKMPQPLQARLTQTTNQALDEGVKRIGDHFAFLSLTKQRNNLLMWSHYTDSHKGFVLGFDSADSFFQPDSGKGRDGLREVCYSKDRWVMPCEGLKGLDDDQMGHANVNFFFTKSLEWSYEEELRILAHPQGADSVIKVAGGCDVLLYNFPESCLKEVILGFRMEAAKQKTLIEATKAKYPHARLFQAALDDREFALQIMPLVIDAPECDRSKRVAG